MSRTPRPTPGIRATPSGRWQARYYDPSGRLRGKTFVRKSDARDFLTSVKVDVKQGKWVDPERAAVRFGKLAGEWLDGRISLRATSAARDESYTRNHVLPVFASIPVGRIERADVQAWVKALSDQGLAPRTVRTCYRLLAAILAEAVESRSVGESPCRRIVLPRVPNREQLYLTAEEVEHLADVVNPLFRPLVYSAVYLGCRWSELVGLRRQNLDVLRRQVRIVGTLEEIGGKPRYVEETKSAASRRNLTVPAFLADMLAKHLKEGPAGEFVFLGRDGALLRRSTFRRRYWKPAIETAGLDMSLRFHDLRHSCAALLIAQGAHPKEIQARLGHASITTTLNTYGHLWPSLGAQLDERIDAVHRQARSHVASMWPAGGSEVISLKPGRTKSGL